MQDLYTHPTGLAALVAQSAGFTGADAAEVRRDLALAQGAQELGDYRGGFDDAATTSSESAQQALPWLYCEQCDEKYQEVGEDHLNIAHSEIQKQIEALEKVQEDLDKMKRLVSNIYKKSGTSEPWAQWL